MSAKPASGTLLLRAALLMTRRERIAAFAIAAFSIVAGLVEASIVVLVVPIVYAVVDPGSFAQTTLGGFANEWFAAFGAKNPVIWLLAATIFLLFAAAAIRLVTIYASEAHAVACRVRLARSILEKIIDAPFEWSMQRRTAEHMNLVISDVDGWRNDYIQNLLSGTQSVFLILFPSIAVVALASATGLAAIAVIGLLVALIVATLRPKIRRIAAWEIGVRDIVARHLLQTLNGLREVKLSTNAKFFVDAYTRESERSGALHVQARFVSAIPGIAIVTLGQVGFLAAAFFIWWMERSPADAAANLALMGILVARVLPAFNALGNQVAQLAKAAPNVERILDTLAELDAQVGKVQRTARLPFPAQWRRLSLCAVSKNFSVDRSLALGSVSYTFERGKVYGLVGKSGAGKSTMANILVGLVDPSAGEVLLDEMPLAQLEIRDWHARIGYVPQSSFVLDASVAENLAFGVMPDAARVENALAQARLTDVVATMDAQARANLGERGGKLSGGQIQRLAIARALYRDPEFLVFDEATSALDQETESQVQQALSMRNDSRLTIIIAHRLKTLTACDEILVLEDGKLLAAGTFETLKRSAPAFQMMLDAGAATTLDKPNEAPDKSSG